MVMLDLVKVVRLWQVLSTQTRLKAIQSDMRAKPPLPGETLPVLVNESYRRLQREPLTQVDDMCVSLGDCMCVLASLLLAVKSFKINNLQ